MVPRCRDYLWEESTGADIIIRTEDFRPDAWQGMSKLVYYYMETASRFYRQILTHNGMMLHASAVTLDGRAYLFSGPPGTGKSTHTGLWQQFFGESARIINDDKPALRFIDGRWIAYGTPWCGKDGINLNEKAPLGGICFLKQAAENRIRRLDPKEATQNLIYQTVRKFQDVESLDLMLSLVDKLVCNIPIFCLENRPEIEAAMLSYETMRRSAEDAGL